MGNRGCIHRGFEVVRRQSTRRWIICTLTYKDWHREVMQPGLYTELFFADEATAFAAGHRPCMFCRREAAQLFLRLTGFERVDDLDAALDLERRAVRPQVDAAELPDGAMVEWQGLAWLVSNGTLREWDWEGYGPSHPIPQSKLTLLTPTTIVRALRQGYVCQLG